MARPFTFTLPLPLRLARRELRGGVTGLWTFLACLALGVGAIAAVGGLSASFSAGVASQAAAILGGDLEASQSSLPATDQERALFTSLGRVSEVLSMRAMAWTDDPAVSAASTTAAPAKRALASLKAVDGAYPLVGTMLLQPSMPLAKALEQRDGVYGAVVHPDMLARLFAKVGDSIGIGEATFQIRAVILQEPDRSFRLLAFGPRLIVSLEGMKGTGLVQPGSMIRYEYRVKLAGADAAQAVEKVKTAYPGSGWRVVAASDAEPSLRNNFQRLGGLMALVGLSALLLGGLGVSEAVAGYLDGKTRTIATFKALGASGTLVFWIFLPQILLLTLAGIAIGLSAGAAISYFAAPVLGAVLPVTPVAALYPRPLLLAGLFGLLTALTFALPPLSSRTRVSPLSLFRGYVAPERPRPGRAAMAWTMVFGAAMAFQVLAASPDKRLGWGFLGSVAVCAVVFWLVARLLTGLARILPTPGDTRLALAVAALHRPGNPTAPVVFCLGLGLTVLAAVSLSDANFQQAMRTELPANAPSFFFMDIQPSQLEEFERIVLETPGVTRLETAPSLRGRIVTVKGVAAENLDVPESVAWALRGDRSLTYSGPMPENTKLTDGTWWPPDHAGKPLVSMDQEIALGLGLTVGDTVGIYVLGREVELTLSSLRRINWLSLALNHVFVLSPGVLEDLPMSYLATAYVDRNDPVQEAQAVYDRVTRRFGNVSVQRVDEALDDVGRVARQIALAIRISASVTLLAGLLVLAQSLRAALARRVYETVIYKVCGATRQDILAIMLAEHGLAGLVAGMTALGLGALLSWFFVSRYMEIDWSFFAGPVLLTVGGATATTLLLALAGVWRMLGRKAWPYLRND